MAFLGRMNSRGRLVDSEVYDHSRCKIIPITSAQKLAMDKDGSRTYVRNYDLKCPNFVSSPGTVRYVGDSESSCELNSMAETEVSTLRFQPPRSLETESESATLCNSNVESGSDYSSLLEEESRSHTDEYAEEAAQQQPLEQLELDRSSTTSMCSWEEEERMSTYEDAQNNYAETQSGCVPRLELGSATVSISYDQPIHSDQLKLLRQSNEAYDNWLSAKRRQSHYKRLAAEELRAQQQQDEAMRRQRNEQCVREWRKGKALKSVIVPAKSRQSVDKTQNRFNQEAMQRLHEWEIKKIAQAEERRRLQQQEAHRKEQELIQRKQQAALAWKQWMKGVAHRPKPVPLNQGLKTLRGTISEIYINPNQWAHVTEKTRI